MTGVLRSWEERFGLVPVMLRSAWTAFQVIAPPRDEANIELLAAELFSFAIDSALQGGFHNFYSDQHLTEQQMAQSRKWLIWWD